MSIPKIDTHASDALKRLMEQYKGKPNIEKIISIYTKQVQEFEDALYPMFDALNIDNMSGQMLDLIGEIVGQPREGVTDDARYRVLIKVQIGKNVSEGEPERIINVFQLLTESVWVQFINLFDAEISLTGTVGFPTQEAVNELIDSMQEVVAGGVRVSEIICADETEAFAFAGPGPAGLGFDDGSDTLGGMFAVGYNKKLPFAFDGDDQNADGLGAGSDDPLVGGVFVS